MNLSLSVVLPFFPLSETNNILSHVERVKKKIEEELKIEKRKRDETKDKKEKKKDNHDMLDMNESEGIVSEDTFFVERAILLASEWSPFSKHKDAIKARMMMYEPDLYKDVLYLLYGMEEEEKNHEQSVHFTQNTFINHFSKQLTFQKEDTNPNPNLQYSEDGMDSPNSSKSSSLLQEYTPSKKLQEWRQKLDGIIKRDKVYIQNENEPSSES
jgi:hypothetical protein